MSESATISIYSPSSQMRTPILLLRSIWKGIRESRELSWRLFLRDLSAQYRQSIFGVLWAFAPPIVTGLIFIALRSSSVVNLGETDIPYPVFALVGTMLWQLFTDSLNAPLKSATAAKPLMAKVSFPHEALIVSAFFMSMFNFLVKSLLILAILLIFGMAPHWTLLAAPAVMLLLILLGITIGLLITPIGMLYTDVASALPIVTQLLFFLTPVVYPPPTSFPFSLLATVNVVSPLLIASRDLITKGTITNLLPALIVGVAVLCGLLVAAVIYRVAVPIIVERISA
ncbi:MAG: ABC transporter permease [Acidobacteriota bacterium]